LIERKCIICDTIFYVKFPSTKTCTCSKVCKNKLASSITQKQFKDPENRKRHAAITQSAMAGLDMKKIVRERRRSFKGKNHPLYGKPCSDERKKKIGDANRGRFKGLTWDEMYDSDTVKRMRKINSEHMCRTNTVLLNNRTSKLEKSAAVILVPHGFRCNVQVGKYVADFLNVDTRRIIEIYGDYWHANPSMFQPDDVISTIKMTASDKWLYDKKRKKYLEQKGYDVTIVWESEFSSKKIKSLVV